MGLNRRSRTVQVRAFIMAAQVAVACVLLVGASLLARSFLALLDVDRGYNPSGVVIARLSLPDSLYTPERRFSIVDELLNELSMTAGTEGVSFTSELPLTSGGSTAAMTMRTPRTDTGIITAQASPRLISPRYFPAIGMRLIQGRSFLDSDTQTAPPVAIVNRSFARRYLNDSALGAMVPMGVGFENGDAKATIVGIVDDVRYLSPTEPTQPELYYSYLQLHGRMVTPTINLVVHTAGNPSEFVPELRKAARAVDKSLVPDAISTMEERMVRGLARPRLYAVLLGGFAIFALIVAGVGLFGVLSYLVTQRSRELALRSALGARQIDLVRQVLGHGMTVTSAGLVAGLFASAMLVRFITAMLYGVTTHDPITYLAVPALVLVVAAIACLAPALRASRVDPIRLLKA